MIIRTAMMALLFSSASALAQACPPGDIDLTNYTLTFGDEFTAVSVSSTSPKGAATWYYWPPYGAAGAYSASQWDAAAFTAAGSILSDKAFTDTAGKWHSGNLSSVDPTRAGFSQMWGYFEIRARMPNSASGAWPAFWLGQIGGIPPKGNGLGEELDVFEWYGVSHDSVPGVVQQASHNWNPDGTQDQSLPHLYEPQTPMVDSTAPWSVYHNYGLMVAPDFITWYIDGIQTNQIATPTSHMTSPFYMMVDYALGGGWPLTGMVNNSHFDVDWVRVYAPPPAPASASFVKIDTSTQGSWPGVYGWDGYNLAGDPTVKTPVNVMYSGPTWSPQTYVASSSDVRALVKPELLTDRRLGTYQSSQDIVYDINVLHGQEQIEVYMMDWDTVLRADSLTIKDAVTGAVLDTRSLAAGSFHNGAWVVWNVTGHVKLVIHNTGPYYTTVSAILFQ